MTVATGFFNWQQSRLDPREARFERDSQNLRVILEELLRAGGASLGIHSPSNRPIRGGTAYSSHAYGAAADWRWGWHPDVAARFLTREYLDDVVIPWLIGFSSELHVQAIHDQGRIWRAYRSRDSNGGWKKYATGYGAWLHIETTLDGFEDDRPLTARGVPRIGQIEVPDVTPPPALSTFDPREGDFGLWPLHQPAFGLSYPPTTGIARNSRGDHVAYLQGVILHRAGGNITVDGHFGRKTERRVRDLQSFFRSLGLDLAVDGWVGAQTWPIVHLLATIERS